jgi:hypothetical protein
LPDLLQLARGYLIYSIAFGVVSMLPFVVPKGRPIGLRSTL